MEGIYVGGYSNEYPPPPPPPPPTQAPDMRYFNPEGAIRDVLMKDGQQFIGQYSHNLVNNTGGWIDNNLRPFFAVDDVYIVKKLGILMFPFVRRRSHEIEQPDLYIPLMSFLTYVLAAGYMLGMKDKFSPEQLGMLSSSAMLCLSLEVCLMAVLFNIFNVKSCYSFLHYVAFCGYKFVPIIGAMMISLLFKNTGYLLTIGYATLALGYYTIKSFHVAIESSNQDNFDHKVSRTGIYIVGLFSLLQPLFMFWLSYHLVP